MKIGQRYLIEAIEHLDPAQNGLVNSLSIGLSTGFTVYTDNVTVGQIMVEARQFDVEGHWHYFAKDEIVNLQVVFDLKACESEDVTPHIADVLNWSKKRR